MNEFHPTPEHPEELSTEQVELADEEVRAAVELFLAGDFDAQLCIKHIISSHEHMLAYIRYYNENAADIIGADVVRVKVVFDSVKMLIYVLPLR